MWISVSYTHLSGKTGENLLCLLEERLDNVVFRMGLANSRKAVSYTHLEELIVKLNDFKSELFSLRFQLATGQLENTARIKFVKKDIARVKTILAERKLNETRA